MRKIIKAVSLIVLLTLLVSCQVTSNLSLADKKSGTSLSSIKTDSFFEGVLEDLSSWKASGSNDPVTDVAIQAFAENLEQSSYSRNVVFTKTDEHSYTGEFAFSDFTKLLEDLCGEYKDQDLLTLTQRYGRTRLEIKMTLENYDVLASILPFLGDPNFEVWGPKYNNPPYDYLTEEDYKDLVSFVLGEDGPESIDNSYISIIINTPETIKITNGTKLSDTKVSFTFPLIDFLLLHEDICFYCEF